MLYSSLTPSLINRAVQNLLKNFGSLSVISSPRRPQSTRFKPLRKAWVYYLVDHISIPLIRIIRLENLQVIDIKALNPCELNRRAKTKSRVNV